MIYKMLALEDSQPAGSPLLNDCFLLTVLVYLPALGNLCILFDVLDHLSPTSLHTDSILPCRLALKETLVESFCSSEVTINQAGFHRTTVGLPE